MAKRNREEAVDRIHASDWQWQEIPPGELVPGWVSPIREALVALTHAVLEVADELARGTK